MRESGHRWGRHSEPDSDKEGVRKLYRRNFLLMIISLGAAVAVLVLSRFWQPVGTYLQKAPEAIALEKILEGELPEYEFEVVHQTQDGQHQIEVDVISSESFDDLDGLFGKLETHILDENKFETGQVVIRLYERWRKGPDETLVSISIKRTTIEEIRKGIQQ